MQVARGAVATVEVARAVGSEAVAKEEVVPAGVMAAVGQVVARGMGMLGVAARVGVEREGGVEMVTTEAAMRVVAEGVAPMEVVLSLEGVREEEAMGVETVARREAGMVERKAAMDTKGATVGAMEAAAMVAD